nr:MAG TPA: hypothetical protein [Caudoviricetes sp.]
MTTIRFNHSLFLTCLLTMYNKRPHFWSLVII